MTKVFTAFWICLENSHHFGNHNQKRESLKEKREKKSSSSILLYAFMQPLLSFTWRKIYQPGYFTSFFEGEEIFSFRFVRSHFYLWDRGFVPEGFVRKDIHSQENITPCYNVHTFHSPRLIFKNWDSKLTWASGACCFSHRIVNFRNSASSFTFNILGCEVDRSGEMLKPKSTRLLDVYCVASDSRLLTR